jgi:DNA-binding protein HU-beta
MTKAELQVALAPATETNKRNAAVFLCRETLSALAYKEIKKNSFCPVLASSSSKRGRHAPGFNPKMLQKIKILAKTVVKFRVAKAAKDAILGVKK